MLRGHHPAKLTGCLLWGDSTQGSHPPPAHTPNLQAAPSLPRKPQRVEAGVSEGRAGDTAPDSAARLEAPPVSQKPGRQQILPRPVALTSRGPWVQKPTHERPPNFEASSVEFNGEGSPRVPGGGWEGSRSPRSFPNCCWQPGHEKSRPLRPRCHHCLASNTGDFEIASMKTPQFKFSHLSPLPKN